MQNEIKHTWHFSQSPQVVWEYLTQPELLEQWFTKTDFRPIAGQKFNFYDKSGKIVSCEVLEVNPVTKLSYSWRAFSANDHQPFDSKVEWTLVPKEHGTELQLVHNGFIALVDYMAHNDGWTRLGTRFADLLNTIKK
jgi:uncharacterized protein YndB with AHSA1/START domain